MPPRGRSSSSRSSSSRSRSSSSMRRSSSSSRSRSTSSHRSSYSPSRPKSRSSSYSSSFNSSPSFNRSYHNDRPKNVETNRKGRIFARNYKRPVRNVPEFVKNNQILNPIFHHCLKHDYYYFNDDFIDSNTGISYKKGYYDEEGTYYDSLTLDFSKMETISLYTCEHCGTSQKIDLENIENNKTLVCESCGAAIDVNNAIALNIDYYVCDENDGLPNEYLLNKNSYSYDTHDSFSSSYEAKNFTNHLFGTIISFFAIFMGVIIMSSLISSFNETIVEDFVYEDNYYYDSYKEYDDYYDYKMLGDKIFVSKIGRYCTFDGDFYYDKDTDCYFCYNTDVDVPTMQFWFEDFSSKYGDYGWLEFDETENCWYVQVDEYDWEKVSNPPDYFWYTTFEELLIDNNISR